MNVFVRVSLAAFVVPFVLGLAAAQEPGEKDQAAERVRLSLGRGAYVDAERDARQLTDVVAAQHGPDSLELAQASDLLIQALVRNGQAAAPSTLLLAERVVRLKEQHVGRVDLETALSLHGLAAVYL